MSARDDHAAKTHVAGERRALRRYVEAWIDRNAGVDPATLARLVAAAPAKQTLTDYQWWNVALILAQGTIPSKERVVPSINHPSPKEAGWLDRDSPSTAYGGRDDL